MKLLWHSNAPFARTGYGNQTRVMVPRLKDAGHDIAVSAFYGLQGGTLVIDDIPLYPSLGNGDASAYGNDILLAHAHHHFGEGRESGKLEDGLIVTLIDVWVLAHELFRAPARTAAWVPVDHDPTPPMVRQFFEATDCIPIAMSRFGERMLKEFDPLYCPHGIDTKAFRPIPRDAARQRVKLPAEPFVVGMVAANKGNPSRKAFSEAFDAFAQFRKTEAGKDAHLYIHTEAFGKSAGVHLPSLLGALGMEDEYIHFPDQYRYQVTGYDDDYMAHLYSSFDVLMNPAFGEGFGIPVIEAQSCGTPVIVSDFSAMPEVGKIGWHVGGQRYWTYQHSWQLRPDVDQIVWALGEAAKHGDNMRGAARDHGLTYDANHVCETYMIPALEEAWRRCCAREPIVLKREPLPLAA